MSDEQTTDETPTVTERWTFTGLRMWRDGAKTVRVHEWLDERGKTLTYAASGSPAIGYVYDVGVQRPPDGRVTRIGKPRWTGERDPAVSDDVRLSWAAADRAAAQALAAVSAERKAATRDDFETAIAALARACSSVPRSQRNGLIGYIVKRLIEQW